MKNPEYEKMIKDLSKKSGLSKERIKEIGNNATKMANEMETEEDVKRPNFGIAPLPDDDW